MFICVDDPPAAERVLAAFGLTFDLRAIHHGQGTANACAFFDNAYLELLGRHDDAALRCEAVRPLALWERVRWRETGASPFGVGLRPDPDGIHLGLEWDDARGRGPRLPTRPAADPSLVDRPGGRRLHSAAAVRA